MHIHIIYASSTWFHPFTDTSMGATILESFRRRLCIRRSIVAATIFKIHSTIESDAHSRRRCSITSTRINLCSSSTGDSHHKRSVCLSQELSPRVLKRRRPRLMLVLLHILSLEEIFFEDWNMETLRICNRSVILRKFGSTCSKTLNPNSAWRRHCLQTPSTSTISFVFRCFPLFVGFDVDPSLGFAKSLHVLITMWILRRDHRVAFWKKWFGWNLEGWCQVWSIFCKKCGRVRTLTLMSSVLDVFVRSVDC